MTAARRWVGWAAAGLVLAVGCRNPFSPSSDVELAEITANGGASIILTSGNVSAPQPPYENWRATCHVLIRNKVAVTLESVSLNYVDLNGNPVTQYANTGGRNFKIVLRCLAVQGNGEFDLSEGRETAFQLDIADAAVLAEFRGVVEPADVIFANLDLRGEDDNGYDVKLSGRIPIHYIH